MRLLLLSFAVAALLLTGCGGGSGSSSGSGSNPEPGSTEAGDDGGSPSVSYVGTWDMTFSNTGLGNRSYVFEVNADGSVDVTVPDNCSGAITGVEIQQGSIDSYIVRDTCPVGGGTCVLVDSGKITFSSSTTATGSVTTSAAGESCPVPHRNTRTTTTVTGTKRSA